MTTPVSDNEFEKRVVLVGNADVAIDYGELVDSSEVVLRFNECPNLGNNTGNRTTILCLINTGAVGRDLYRKEGLKGFGPARTSEIWFRGRRDSWLDILLTLLVSFPRRKKKLDYGPKMMRANQLSNPVVYADRSLLKRVRRKLWQVDPKRPWKNVNPTSGFLALERVMADPRFDGYEVCLVGFTWEKGGPKRTFREQHTWDEEETLCRQYESKGLLKILPCE